LSNNRDNDEDNVGTLCFDLLGVSFSATWWSSSYCMWEYDPRTCREYSSVITLSLYSECRSKQSAATGWCHRSVYTTNCRQIKIFFFFFFLIDNLINNLIKFWYIILIKMVKNYQYFVSNKW
jgi:hypothetical protein